MTTAGHSFTNSAGGRACESCGMTRRQLHQATEEAIGEQGWARPGVLTRSEYEQIFMDRELNPQPPASIWDRIRKWLGCER